MIYFLIVKSLSVSLFAYDIMLHFFVYNTSLLAYIITQASLLTSSHPLCLKVGILSSKPAVPGEQLGLWGTARALGNDWETARALGNDWGTARALGNDWEQLGLWGTTGEQLGLWATARALGNS